MKKLTIQEWNPDDRPREKLLTKGTESLSDAELLAILIGSGNSEENAVELSKRILASVNNDLNTLGRCTVNELIKQFKGVGEAKAVSIIAAVELGLRRKRFDMDKRDIIRSSKDIYLLMYPELVDKPHEELWIVLLNNANKVIGKKRIGQGGISQTVADVRLILREVILSLASGVILCHNHPSGTLKPSNEDIHLTRRTSTLLSELGTRLLDHLILTDGNYYSFADEGML